MTTQSYIVTVTMNPSHSAQVIVDATSAEDANDTVIAKIGTGEISPKFELDEDSLNSAELYLPDPESTELADEADLTPAAQHYFCTVTEVNGEYEYPSHFLARCEPDEDIDDILTETLHSIRGEADPDTATGNWADFDDGTAAKNPTCRPISAEEYTVMRQYLRTA